MARFFLTLTALLVLSIVAIGQRKLILYNPEESHVFRTGDEVGLSLKGQPFVFGNWKTTCKPCDSTVQKSLWTIDSIADHAFTLSQITSYTFDTLSYEDYMVMVKAYRKQKKRFPLIENTYFRDTIATHIEMQDTVKVTEKQEMCVLKFPNITRQTVYYDSIQSLTYSRFKSEESCSRGYIILPAAIGLVGVYALITEGVKRHPDKRTVWISIGSIVSGTIFTKMSLDIRKNNVETIHMIYWKRKTK